MLFVIGQSVGGLFASGGAGQPDVESLEYLALGSAEGSHRISGTRQVLTNLSGNTVLHTKTRKVFERAAARVAQEGRLQYQLTVYGQVEAGSGLPTSTTVGTKRVITFPLRWFNDSTKVQITVLLGENLSDACVLHSIGEAGTVLAGLPYLPLKSKADHGGGSSIGQVLHANANANCICICIVDSDRACPLGTLGNTAATVQPFKNTAIYPLIEVSETSSRDLENILPDNFYRSEYSNHQVYSIMVGVMEHLTQCGETDLRSYLDIEKGVTLRQIFNYPVNSPERVFWGTKLQILLAHMGIAPATLPCLTAGSCAAMATGPCTCAIVAGNSSNILQSFASRFSGSTRYNLASCLDKSVRPEWLRLGAGIASWCCGDDRLRM
jgi:hypothetical protein